MADFFLCNIGDAAAQGRLLDVLRLGEEWDFRNGFVNGEGCHGSFRNDETVTNGFPAD